MMSTKRPTTRRCAGCDSESSYIAKIYCSVECRRLARVRQSGKYPVGRCPRCGRLDLCIVTATESMCQTCGWHPDSKDRRIVRLTPRSSPTRLERELTEAHGEELFAK